MKASIIYIIGIIGSGLFLVVWFITAMVCKLLDVECTMGLVLIVFLVFAALYAHGTWLTIRKRNKDERGMMW